MPLRFSVLGLRFTYIIFTMKQIICLLIFGVLIHFTTQAQDVSRQLYEGYDQYKEMSITQRRFKQADIVPLLQALRKVDGFEVTPVGKSIQGRTIYMVKVGRGSIKVLLWSQMHGNEPTATMASLDIFNFFQQKDDLDPVRREILNNTTLYFIPMLNPDGAQTYERRNAIDIDLNRDALRLQSPESRLLKRIRDSLDADFGFNLHDQSTHYTAGVSDKSATLSFLAPAYDYEKSVNEVRKKALQLVITLNEAVQTFAPGHVGRYNDDFEPRAFGDNIQKWGTSTVLVESGGYPSDPEKQYIRKLNFVLLLTGLHAIATESYKNKHTDDYYQIPENERYLYDLVIRNATLPKFGNAYTIDLGINRYEVEYDNHQQFYHSSSIADVGDLSVYHGYEELDAAGLTMVPGNIYPKKQRNIKKLLQLNTLQLLKEGYTTVRLKKMKGHEKVRDNFPLDIIGKKQTPAYTLGIGSRPDFILMKDDVPRYAVVNGVVHTLE